MIASLKLSNFQSHADTTLAFHPCVNAIIGKTDSGKSSIIRALRLVIENKPSGTEFIKQGTSQTEVTVQFDDCTVSRAKGTKNNYKLNGEVLKAFGQSVPDEVKDAVRIDAELSIQKQASPYFLLGISESERSKLINSLCNMALSSESVATARRNALRATRDADTLREQLTPLRARQVALNAFRQNESLVLAIDTLETSLSTLKARYERLVTYATTYNKLNSALVSVASFDSRSTVCTTYIQDAVTRLSGSQSNLTQLTGIAGKLKKGIPNVLHYDDFDYTGIVLGYERTRQLEACLIKLNKPVPKSITIDTSIVDKLQELVVRHSALTAKCTELATTAERIAKGQALLSTELTILTQWKVCPLCGNDMGKVCE
jgi:DNA repair exonuclease SbcCD ATPase subunit